MQTQDVAPLDGVLVVAIEQAVAAPLCSSRLADAGARVIKVERPAGDFARGYDQAVHGESSYFVWTNRGKESVVVDLKSEQGLALIHSMLGKADVFLQNLAPGATDRLGLGADELRERYPRLITCDISGYGDQEGYRDMKAYDLLIQCESGLVSVSGGPESYGRIGVSLCDIAAGMNALVGIQQALLKRHKTGRGSHVQVSLFDGAADWMSVPILHQKYTGNGPKRVGLKHPSIAPYGDFKTADDQIIVISIQNNREWANFCRDILNDETLTDDPRFATNNDRVTNRPALEQIISRVFAQYSRDEMKQRLLAAGIAYGSLNDTKALIEHPLLRYTTVETSTGPAEIVAPPVIFDRKPAQLGKVPALGEHTIQIEREFTLSNSLSEQEQGKNG